MPTHLTDLTQQQIDELTDRLILSLRKRASGCIEWILSVNKIGGYGRVKTRATKLAGIRAHRLAYELFIGPITDKLHVLHKCDNPRCCNPQHLFLGTHRDNMQDGARKGRFESKIKGESHPKSKLTSEQVRRIRLLYATGHVQQTELARAFNVSTSVLNLIVLRKVWTHV